jgi:NAD(P)H-dependent flavin oxidoreductase YrpB (nitropropane dioxygenase family)
VISKQSLYVWIRPRVLAQLMLPIQTAELLRKAKSESRIHATCINPTHKELMKMIGVVPLIDQGAQPGGFKRREIKLVPEQWVSLY